MRAEIQRLSRQLRAIAAVEFALLAPVMLLLAGGIVDGGLLLRTYTAVNALTMQYAVSYADCDLAQSCQNDPAMYGAANTLANVAPELTASKLTLTMFQVSMSGTTPTVNYSYSTTGSTPSLTAAQTSALQAVVPSGQNGVVVTASYQYSLQFFSTVMSPVLGSNFTITYTVAQLQSQT